MVGRARSQCAGSCCLYLFSPPVPAHPASGVSSWGLGTVFTLASEVPCTSRGQRKPTLHKHFPDEAVTFRAITLYMMNSDSGEIFMDERRDYI